MQLLGVGLLLPLRWGVLGAGLSQAGDPTASLCILLSPLAPPSFSHPQVISFSVFQISFCCRRVPGPHTRGQVPMCREDVLWRGAGHVQCVVSWEGASWTGGVGHTSPLAGAQEAPLRGEPTNVLAPSSCLRWITRAGIFFMWQFRTLISRASCS